jgi:DNA-binding winged helix-turn-helix (wHTH) protein
MEVLVSLANHKGEVVSRNELFQEVWPGIHVTDDALGKCIGELRRIFNGNRGGPPVIETISKRGYRIAVSAYEFASLYVRTGENGRAMDMIEAAYRQHSHNLAWIRARAVWQRLRSDHRYQSLLRRMRFPE